MKQDAIQEFDLLVKESLRQQILWKLIFSHHGTYKEENPVKIEIRPIKLREKLVYQVANHFPDKVFHENMTRGILQKKLVDYAAIYFLQVDLETQNGKYRLVKTKKGFILKKNEINLRPPDFSHNRKKNHLWQEGTVVPSLVSLGIMDKNGFVFPNKRDKFNQINRFLEIVAEVFSETSSQTKVLVDFGCGKAYLTFALMEMMKQKNRAVDMLGVDKKKEVIKDNKDLSKELGFSSSMSFVAGNIQDPLPYQKVDIVIALHACDTATDDAILQGLKYGADWLLVAPCCQHELYQQIKTPVLKPLIRYGILKERIASLFTDAIRASFLEAFGYQVDIVEFVDTEHTPKNIMIRAKKIADSFSKEKFEKCVAWTHELGVVPYIIENMERIL